MDRLRNRTLWDRHFRRLIGNDIAHQSTETDPQVKSTEHTAEQKGVTMVPGLSCFIDRLPPASLFLYIDAGGYSGLD